MTSEGGRQDAKHTGPEAKSRSSSHSGVNPRRYSAAPLPLASSVRDRAEVPISQDPEPELRSHHGDGKTATACAGCTGRGRGRGREGRGSRERRGAPGLAVGMTTAISAPREALAAPDESAQGGVAVRDREPLAGIDAIAHGGDGEEGQQTNGGGEDDGFHDVLQCGRKRNRSYITTTSNRPRKFNCRQARSAARTTER